MTAAAYGANLTPVEISSGTGECFDVSVGTGSSFTSLTVEVCDVGVGDSLDWWNGSDWMTFSNVAVASTSCITATVSTSTSPDLHELTGTVVAVVVVPAG